MNAVRVAALTLIVAASIACARLAEREPAVPFEAPAPPLVVETPPAPAAWDLDWARGAVFYQVFVRSFQDSDGDGVGDLKGLIARLDYLNDGKPGEGDDLGVDGIWLMPVHESPSYHGYDVVDYENIDREYGTNDDFARLCEEAKKRGMRVILDLVVNHSGVGHPWFSDPARRDWYVRRADDPGWTQPWGSGPTWHRGEGGYYHGIFWSGMPDLNWRNPAVRVEMARLARLWLDRGAAGFRLDATRHLVETGPGDGQNDSAETHAVLREFSAAVRAHRPDALLVGENWTSTDRIAEYYGDTAKVKGGDELPMSFDFPVAAAIVDGVRSGDASGIAAALREVQRTYPAGVLDAPFLTNHDMIRIGSVVGPERERLRAAAGVLLTLPGTPFLYYGEEIGLQNGAGRDDEQKRTPMPWDAQLPGRGFTTGTPWHAFAPGDADVAAERGAPSSLWETYRTLIASRREHPALRRGDLEVLTPEGERTPLLAFARTTAEERVRVVVNLGGAEAACPAWACGSAAQGQLLPPGETVVLPER